MNPMIYLDNSATTALCPEAEGAIRDAIVGFGNPSSLHSAGQTARKTVETARKQLLAALDVRLPDTRRVIFTSCGTEANNLAIFGTIRAKSFRFLPRVITTDSEHPSILETLRYLEGRKEIELCCLSTRGGKIELSELDAALNERTVLLSLMQVNNETGAVQPLQEISRLRDKYCPNALLHVDGVQGFLRVPFDMRALKVDSYALSGHKIHGPKGIGALVCGNRLRLAPILVGGGQENNLRSGTENTPGILALGAAILAYPGNGDMKQVKCYLYEKLKALVPDARVNGPDPMGDWAAPHILNISLPPVRSETMLHALEGMGIYVGIGSACSSHKQKVSHTLRTMNVPQKYAEAALRFSFCPDNTREEMDQVLAAFEKNYALLSRYQRR